MFMMRADPLRGQVGGGWALEIETFLGPAKWRRAVRRVPFGAQQDGFECATVYTKTGTGSTPHSSTFFY
jgi:hypothetical protein